LDAHGLQLVTLDVRLNNELQSLPTWVFNTESLRELNVSGNALQSVDERLGRLRALETLDLAKNQLSLLPQSLGRLSSLRELHLSCNYYLGSLNSSSIFTLANLHTLDIMAIGLHTVCNRL
jgi:Leucine-rich repeat (LRR) protein